MASVKDNGQGALFSHQELTSPDLETDPDIENYTSLHENNPLPPEANLAETEPSPKETHSLNSSSIEPPRKRRRLSTSKRTSAGNDLHKTIAKELGNIEESHSRIPSFEIRIPELTLPKSTYQAGVCNVVVKKEFAGLRDILGNEEAELRCGPGVAGKPFANVDLEGFSIYRPMEDSEKKTSSKKKLYLEKKTFAGGLASLHKTNKKFKWQFDGVISYGAKKAYVENVPFTAISIEGHEDNELDTVDSSIFIQSVLGRKSRIRYNLKSPASEYKRYHDAFLWVADLSKHLNHYLRCHENVSLREFRCSFSTWLQATHGASSNFKSWQSRYGDTDYRRAVAAHIAYLYRQALLVDKRYGSHPLWGEIDPERLDAVPKQTNGQTEKTVVTQFVYGQFATFPFAKNLEPVDIAPDVVRRRGSKAAFKLSKPSGVLGKPKNHSGGPGGISVGDVVEVKSDKRMTWYGNGDSWYGFVQGTTESNDRQALDIIWLCRSCDTAFQGMKYAHDGELFLSHHCNCGDHRIYADEVIKKLQVDFFANPLNVDVNADFFVRQTYGAKQGWVTLRESDFRCSHMCSEPSNMSPYEPGDTLLVETLSPKGQEILEPVEFDGKVSDGKDLIRVRRLPRRGRDCGHEDAEPNELVYTDKFAVIYVTEIVRRCHIRFFTEEDKQQKRIPDQYRRQGTGDFWYIIYQDLQAQGDIKALSKPWPSSLKQGWDCNTSSPSADTPMVLLDLFSGGGNFSRAFEEAGIAKTWSAVDWDKFAIHTHRANAEDPDHVLYFCGSINDYLRQAIQGTDNPLVAPPGSVEVICAGSPCQGFSSANLQKGNDKGLQNVSMVTSVLTAVDLYRPKYAVLENVTNMAKCNPKDQDPNMFAQTLCCLVALGYQARPFILDAWNFGSPQSRTRLFITIAAPGLTPLDDPPHSHSHPNRNTSHRSLGLSADGSGIGSRRFEVTPFEHVTIGEATKDLPLNFDGRVDCIPFPDHRPSRNMSTFHHHRISSIPRFPAGMTFVKATARGLPEKVELAEAIGLGFKGEKFNVKAGRMPKDLTDEFNWNSETRGNLEKSTGWKRVNPDALMGTVTTSCRPEDGQGSSVVHWDACRCLTVMEARRSQGFPDHEVIVGNPTTQWKIIGNSVARPVALALGMALRKAWLQNLENSALPALEDSSHSSSPSSSESSVDSPYPLVVFPGIGHWRDYTQDFKSTFSKDDDDKGS